MNTQIIFNGDTLHAETTTDLILHGNSTAKDILDNFNAVPMSTFGQKLAGADSLAEVCRLMHHNYSFAKDAVDEVEWKIVGSPSVDNGKLHVSNGNYIWRSLKLGADTFFVDFDIVCSDSNKIIFQLYDNTAVPSTGTAVRHLYRLLVNSDGNIQFNYITQSGSYHGLTWRWDSAVTRLTHDSGFPVSNANHIVLWFDKTDSSIGVSVNGGSYSWSDPNTCPISNKTWRVYLGNTADALIDNFILTNNDVVVSQLDFS